MYDICGIGHITLDKVTTPHSVTYMPGGTSYYFSNALAQMPLRYLLITSLGEPEMSVVEALRQKGITVNAFRSAHSVYFENIYGQDPDQRTQRVLRKADPFNESQTAGTRATIFHLGPLLADDMSAAFIADLAGRGSISLDVQGFLRKVEGENVVLNHWKDREAILRCADIIKADDYELASVTGLNDVKDGARLLASWGVKEVVITFGSRGSLVYAGGVFYEIPAFIPRVVADTTGCGDTYMAGYLSRRILGKDPREAGEYAAAMSSLKIESHGPFTGTPADVQHFMVTQQTNRLAEDEI